MPAPSDPTAAGFRLVARETRGGRTESWHYGACAVVDPGGRRLARVGDPECPVFLRSAAKPFQAVPLLVAGGERTYGLDDADLALICASHGGTPAHVERVASLLERGGFSADDLACGAHPPFDAASARRLARAGEAPGPLHNNCSGKHAGMLLACRLLGLEVDGYAAAAHPLQRRLHGEVAHHCELPAAAVETAGDGCGTPTYRVPLAAGALAYARLAEPVALDAERRVVAGRLVEAMAGAPEMLAGPGRFTTRLVEVTGGRVVGKEGAQGVYGVAVRGPAVLGVMLKIADGSESCRDGAVLEVLRQLGVLSAAELAELAELHRPAVLDRQGQPVGELLPDLELEDG